MNWRCTERRQDAALYSEESLAAFDAGYSDAFHGYPKWSGNERDWYPRAYNLGFEDGCADARASIQEA